MAENTYILFEDPPGREAGREYPYLGAAPKFVKFLKEWLFKNRHKIKSVKLAVYLFNNFELHKTFRELAGEGIKIDVVSIPPEGYDDSLPQEISPSEEGFTFKQKHTKKTLADLVYNSFMSKPVSGYDLYIFPHAYIRSPRIKPFSRGKVPYSLHLKSFLVTMENSTAMVGITSSNMAMRDLVKHDFFVLRKAGTEESVTTDNFFSHLIGQSVKVTEYKYDKSNFDYPVTRKEYITNNESLFVSPFYRNSPEEAEKVITRFILSAKERIWIMAQHISSFDYLVPLNFRIRPRTNAVQKREGCLSALISQGKKGIEVKCLSQTFVDDKADSGEYRIPANTYNFRKFIREFRGLPNAAYAVNENIHSKYIIVDGQVIITTFNYTPTQFVSLPFVDISKFEYIERLKFKGVFSEVGHLVCLRNKKDADCFIKNFEYAWNKDETITTI